MLGLSFGPICCFLGFKVLVEYLYIFAELLVSVIKFKLIELSSTDLAFKKIMLHFHLFLLLLQPDELILLPPDPLVNLGAICIKSVPLPHHGVNVSIELFH